MPEDVFDLTNKSILVTGGSGSFGSAFIEHLLLHTAARRIVVYSRDEHKQHDLAQTLESKADRLRFFIGDVRDVNRLSVAMRGVDYVVHAAALKHVTIAEYNPMECIHTNVMGAENVVNAALQNRVRRVISLSTDKAANPINLYGASKLASDKIMVSSNGLSGDIGTRFSVVRYGNVLGSRGSVIPFFQKLIADGAISLPVTNPEMTRFWITLPQAVSFVLSCFGMMSGGEIFVPKLPSANILDLTKALAPDIRTEIIGVRPGEKLHEVLLTKDDSRHSVELDDRYVVEPEFVFWEKGRQPTEGGRPVVKDFQYDSFSNVWRLSIEDLRSLLDTVGS